MRNPIADTLPPGEDEPSGLQTAWHAVVHILVPCIDKSGVPVESETAAIDYISETLRSEFLDWGYMVDEEGSRLTPIPITVCEPYVEGTFNERDS
jgi:hypothetical protein